MRNSAYSPIQHLAKALWFSNWRKGLIGMFTVYFDASGKEKDHEYFVVAGFVASADAWIEFSNQWKKRLAYEGIQYFRGSDAQSREGDFLNAWACLTDDDWHARRSQLWNDLIDIIKPYVRQKFACGVPIKVYQEKLSEEFRQEWRMNAYVMCGMACAERARLWAMQEGITDPLVYIFDQDDVGWGMLKEQFALKDFPEPLPGNSRDIPRRGILHPAMLPLQAADFLAYECFIATKIIRQKRPRSTDRPIGRFKEIKGDIHHFPPMGLDDLVRHFETKKPL